MKFDAIAFLSLLAVFGGGCSDVECSEDEQKIGAVCVGRSRSDAGPARQGDEQVGGSMQSRDAGQSARFESDAGTGLEQDGPATPVAPVDSGLTRSDSPEAAVPSPPSEPSTPVAPTEPVAPTCVPGIEVCDGKDNNCNGQADENAQGATVWYRDCDGDGFAASKDGSFASCVAPAAAGSCKAWVDKEPRGPSTTDCDDSNDLYKPGASYGIPSGLNSSHDLNCDGEIEAQPTLRSVDGKDLNVCLYVATCECYRAVIRNKQPLQDWTNWATMSSTSLVPHPEIACSVTSDDIVLTWRYTADAQQHAVSGTPGCLPAATTSAGVTTIAAAEARQLCR